MALKSLKKKVSIVITKEEYLMMADEYAQLSAQIKILEDKKKSLSEKLKEGATQYGVKDDNGSFYITSPTYTIGRIARKSITFKDSAIAYLKKKKLYDKCVDVETIEKINEDKLKKQVENGKLNLADLRNITDENVTYSVSVKATEEIVPAEETKLASKKRR